MNNDFANQRKKFAQTFSSITFKNTQKSRNDQNKDKLEAGLRTAQSKNKATMPRSRSRSRSRSPERPYRKRRHSFDDDNGDSIYRVPPFYYLHVLDQNTNVTRVEIGPQTFVRQQNHRVLFNPKKMMVVPPRFYCSVKNPVIRGADGTPEMDKFGQARLQHGEIEIRFSQDPFPLFPGEELCKEVSPLKVVTANSALRLRAVIDFEDSNGEKRMAGDQWLFEGPGTYIPRKEVVVVETVQARVIAATEVICLRAVKDCVDRSGVARVTGEEWAVKKVGAYLPGAYEEVVEVVRPYILTEKTALHMKAHRSFTDDFGKQRKSGEEWLITLKDTESHVPNVCEKVVGVVNITSLTTRQYCVVLDPVDDQGKPQLGKKKLIKGEKSFFLVPGESLEKGIQNVYILGEEEGLVLRATEQFMDGPTNRNPGDKWMVKGPVEYVPPVQVDVVMKRVAVPLDENEGIYVRDIKTGKVKAITGQTYMLNHDEELWEKQLPVTVENLLMSEKDPLADRSDRNVQTQQQQHMMMHQFQSTPMAQMTTTKTRDKTRVVTYRVPHNAAVQIYDYKEKKARIIFGPDLVMLGPEEHFTQLSLSGGKPKKPNVIKNLCLLLGPDFCTDIIVVETADHAKLSLQLAYNWQFKLPNTSPEEAAKLFSVPDCIGDACKAVASRVRGAVAQTSFDDFHKNSAKVIRSAVFGIRDGKIGHELKFPQNHFSITSVDIQSVEPVDQRTRDSLQKSVQLAIEITTKSQEATAKHEAERLEQEAKGRLERQKIVDEAEAEKARKDLLLLQANSAAVESTGQAKAEAQSRAEAARIEGEAAVDQAKLKSQAMAIESEADLDRLTRARNAELSYLEQQNRLEVEKNSELSNIEINKFKHMVEAIGSQTLLAMSTAGPDLQVRMLQALGLKSTLITDGSSPINLFNTASGLLGDVVPTKRRKLDDKGDDDDSETTA